MFCTVCLVHGDSSALWLTPWPCDHAVHRGCLARWLASASSDHTCSVCRSNPATPLALLLTSSEIEQACAGIRLKPAATDIVSELRPAPTDVVPCCCTRMLATYRGYTRRMYWCAIDHTWVCYGCGRVVTLGDCDLHTPSDGWAHRQRCQIHGLRQALVTQYADYHGVTVATYSIRCVRLCPALPLEVPELLACDPFQHHAPITIVLDDEDLPQAPAPAETQIPAGQHTMADSDNDLAGGFIAIFHP